MQTIGIGITTRNRPKILKLCIEQMSKYYKNNFKIVIIDDNSYSSTLMAESVYMITLSRNIPITYIVNDIHLGIAKSKNKCLQELKKCDYIFLFDDDCFPISDNWEQFFIDAHLKSKQHHFLHLKESKERMARKIDEKEGIEIYDACLGPFMFLTKEVIQKVGGFNKDYDIYGYEHVGYTKRIFKSGLNTLGEYLSVKDDWKYIYAMDYDNPRPEFKVEGFKCSIGSERLNYIGGNKKVFLEDIKTIYQSL